MVAVIMALRGLTANKLRSFLTMLGVIIGVGAVIIAVAIGEGSREAAAESIRKLGTNVLTVFPGQQKKSGVSFGFGSVNTMKLDDAAAILRGAPDVKLVSPGVNKNMQVKYLNRNTSTGVQGTGPDFPAIDNFEMASGKYFTDHDVRSLSRVAVLGATTATDLFDKQTPVGKTIRIGGMRFLVIGAFKSKGGSGFRNPDDAVYVPVTTGMRRIMGQTTVGNIVAQARNDNVMDKAQAEIDTIMRKRHKISANGTADFIIFNQAQFQQARDSQQETFSKLITYLAIVSLMVGGIGIMNIMLVSVTERTREIGVRKAIGAKKRNILLQFLLEALFLSLVGGLLGVAFGMEGSAIVGQTQNWKVIVTVDTVALAFSFSAVVGVFFGFYPALKAANLHPIEALRYE